MRLLLPLVAILLSGAALLADAAGDAAAGAPKGDRGEASQDVATQRR